MKKALFKLSVFILLFLMIDWLSGSFFVYLQAQSPSYRPGYIAHNAQEDIIIFGSSKGETNYNMELLNDSLKMSCLNCSDTGNGIIQMYGRYKLLTNRYTPKVIVYDVRPKFDLYMNDNSKYTMRLKPFYNETGIDSIIGSVDANEKYKMCSSLYRYNFQFLEIIKEFYSNSTFNHSNENLSRKKMQIIPKSTDPSSSEYDALKLHYMEELIKDCKRRGIHLAFVVSPEYYYYESISYAPLIKLCKEYDIPFIDKSADKEFNNENEYFMDSLHMNYWGATKWSKFIAHYIQDYLL